MKLSVIPYPLAIALMTSALFGAAIGSVFVATLMHGGITSSNSTALSHATQCTTSNTTPVLPLSVASPESHSQPLPQPELVLKESDASVALPVARQKHVSQTENVARAKSKISTSVVDQRASAPIPTPATPAAVPSMPPDDQVMPKSSGESKIEAVYAAKAGVSKVEPDAVTLMTGTRVTVGEKFPSGETLVRIDAANMRLFTDRRQLILFNGKEGMQ